MQAAARSEVSMKRMILQTLKLDMAMLDASFSRGPRAPSDSLDSGR